MKKIIVLIVILIFIAAATVGELLVVLPTATTLEPFATPASSDASYVVENRLYSPCIYTVDADGKVIDIYRTRRMSGDYQAVTSLGSDGDQLYYTRQAVDVDGRPNGGWSLWQYDSTSRRATELTQQPGVGMVKGIAAWQNSLWVTTQDSEDAIVVYQLPLEGGVPQETERLWLPDGNRLLQASYTSTGKITILLESGITVQTVNGMVQDSTNSYPYGHGVGEVSLAPAVWLQLRLPTTLAVFAVIMMLFMLPLPLVLLYRRAHKLLHRVWAVGMMGVIATYVISVALILLQIANVYGQANLYASFEVAGQLATIIGRQGPILLPAEGDGNSTNTQAYRSLLGVQDELLAVQEGAMVVAISSKQPTGTMPSYDDATAAVVEQAIQGTNGSDYSVYLGRPVAVSACGIYTGGKLVGVLVARNGLDSFGMTQAIPLLWLAVVAALLLLLLTLLLQRMLARVTLPIAEMTKKMEAISAGDLTLWKMSAAHDELDGMCRAMQEMCMSLSIRDYEVDSTITSYNRFVPMGLHKLLDRASIQEVTTGDVRTITGTVGLLSVNNRDTARAGLSDDRFVHFVNNCCNTLSNNLVEYGGYLLSSAFDLKASKIFFEGTGNEAVTASMSLMGSSKQNTDDVMLPSFSLILHHTSLLYGIAGGHDKVFPFISSAELEFLQSYNEQFCQAGVRLVLTEKLVGALNNCQVRYIGFIVSDDEQYSYKLYEALGVYSDTQYNHRVRYDDRLQEGIQLFYRSDFYLARNIFSSLLRVSPDDGIVRWYLFACEHYFNCDKHITIDYRLFGIDRPII